MEQKITIEVPEGKKAVYNEKTQVIEFVDIEPIRSRSWKEFCKNHPSTSNEFYIDNDGTILKFCGIIDRKNCANHLSTKEDAEGILALIQLIRLHDEWVGDWKPAAARDYKDYYAIKYDLLNANITVGEGWNTQHILSFPVKEMAKEFLNCFRDLIEKAKRFI